MNIKILFLMLLSMVFVAACTQTKEVDAPVLTFEQMDNDVNGYITMAEAKAKASSNIARHFKQIDSNGDANINIDEFMRYMGKGRMTPPDEFEIPEPGAAPY